MKSFLQRETLRIEALYPIGTAANMRSRISLGTSLDSWNRVWVRSAGLSLLCCVQSRKYMVYAFMFLLFTLLIDRVVAPKDVVASV
jgi:hypothetical protein